MSQGAAEAARARAARRRIVLVSADMHGQVATRRDGRA